MNDRKNIISNKDIKISFFENIIYWLWYYSLKTRAYFPWTFAQLIVSVSKFFNTAIIWLIILKITGIDDKEFMHLIVIAFPVIGIIDMIIFDSRKYSIKKTKYYIVWDEKYCILTDKYDNMPIKQKRNYKRNFLIYMIISIMVSVISIKMFINW
jgi:hypothetical protein